MSITPTETEPIAAWSHVEEPPCAPDGPADTRTAAKANPFVSGTVYEIKGWRLWLLLHPAALLLRLYYATLRLRMDPDEEKALRDTSKPVVGIIWHSRSFVVPMILRRYRDPGKCFCLISASKAAAWEDALFHLLGIPSARGSSTRRSIAAMRELLHKSADGNDIFIAPDGPSGPPREFKRGGVFTARVAKTRVLLFGASSDRAWRPHTWDRHLFPLPFAKVQVRAIMLDNEELFGNGANDDTVCALLTEKLNSLNEDHGL
jgi:lysophospholipid acyltransferase (LPLAT)-like uncharacterized protein